MKGKVGDVVMSVRNGNQIVRKYQPMVFNPSSQGQIEARAKLKLISQVSAAMGPVIAMPRLGVVTPRNQFTKVNYAALSFNSTADPQVATVNLSAIKLTKSSVFLPSLSASYSEGSAVIELNLPSTDVDKVVYCVFQVTSTSELRYVSSIVATSGPNFRVTEPFAAGSKLVVYAYGIRINSDSARAKFDNMTVASATVIASLLTSRALTEADVTLTETRFAEITA